MEDTNLATINSRLTIKVDALVKDLGDVVEEVSKDYEMLDSDAQVHGPDGAITLVEDAILAHVKLPWYLPEVFFRKAIHTAVTKALAYRK